MTKLIIGHSPGKDNFILLTPKKKQWKTKKKVEIPEELLKNVDENRIDTVLKQVNETEEHIECSMETSRQLLEVVRGKTINDLSCGIISLLQLLPFKHLLSMDRTLKEILKMEAINGLRDMIRGEKDS